MTDSNPTGSQAAHELLQQRIAEATGLTVALGLLGVIASVLQILGVFETGVPGWFNLLIAVAGIALGLLLARSSLLLTGLLLAIFVAIIVDTLIATTYVLQNGGWPLGVILVLRYLIMISAARSVASVFKGVIDARRAVVNEGTLAGVAIPAAFAQRGEVSQSAPLQLGTGSSEIIFWVLAGFLVSVAGVLLLALPLEGPVPLMLLFMLAIGGAAGWAASAERNYMTKLIAELRAAVANRDSGEQQKTVHWLQRSKERGTRALAIAALECDPNDAEPAHAQAVLEFVSVALGAIGAIGSLDRDAAQRILEHFVAERCRVASNAASWQSACAAARSALSGVGYLLEPDVR